jgi:hypothetical protein
MLFPKVAKARNSVAKADALRRRQERMVEHLANEGPDALAAGARSTLVVFAGLASTMRALLRQVDNRPGPVEGAPAAGKPAGEERPTAGQGMRHTVEDRDQAQRHVELAQRQVERQEMIVAKLTAFGRQEAEPATVMLLNLRSLLACFREHLLLIESAMRKGR